MNILTSISLAFLFAVGLGLAAAGGLRAAWRSLGRRRGVSAALAVVAVVACVCAQKVTFTLDSYIADDGCYATNDVVHIAFAQAASGLDLSTSPVLVYARLQSSTNAADWFELSPRRMFTAFPADYALADATNYNYAVYVDYVPPPTVHTNGVWQMRGIELARGESAATFAFPNTCAAKVSVSAREYVQDGLYSMLDAIENSSWGVHDGNLYSYKDEAGKNIYQYWHDLAAPSTQFGYTFTEQGNPSGFTRGSGAYYNQGTWEPDAWVVELDNGFRAPYAYFQLFTTNDFTHACVVTRASTNNLTKIGWRPNSNVYLSNTGAFVYGYYDGDTWRTRTISTGINTTDLGQTYTLAITVSYATNEIRIYINGSLFNTCSFPAGEYMRGRYVNSALHLNPGDRMHNVRSYSRALSDDEVRHNYKIDKRRFNLP